MEGVSKKHSTDSGYDAIKDRVEGMDDTGESGGVKLVGVLGGVQGCGGGAPIGS
eukprot:CAMPEP_0204427126 /NCGR_PEP_ID=MMETSP0470-20130426/54249_1 /ASSEMBLY_ACC=CAM_ASM_000385 /TAXON_ID=2969 /ORGANISM="Oxyrrhis marina" /LENGTH=53 /DNA_ID=CAMNT_0051424907 /DNA_START=29 /DNA_END=186 /DNA_ORIENTATION=+